MLLFARAFRQNQQEAMALGPARNSSGKGPGLWVGYRNRPRSLADEFLQRGKEYFCALGQEPGFGQGRQSRVQFVVLLKHPSQIFSLILGKGYRIPSIPRRRNEHFFRPRAYFGSIALQSNRSQPGVGFICGHPQNGPIGIGSRDAGNKSKIRIRSRGGSSDHITGIIR